MQPPSGNVTFLFTDIERSSQLWEKHPQAMGHSLAQHDALLNSIFAERNGYVFKTGGDSFCVAFMSALDGVHAALAAQRQLAAVTWGETGPLRVRMALHSGDAEQRGGDYFGSTLNRVARILVAGHGGQTLLSRVTAERVREELSEAVSLRDLGERRLRDLSRPERIYQLSVADLPSEFPPLRSLEVLPNNLPAQVTNFVGRAREMGEVKRLLGTSRLLTLTGPGGTGKTRLSLQVAADVLDRYTHGVWLVELATVSDPKLLVETVANVVEVREEAGREPLETLLGALRSRRLLLILDNCEHLIVACAQLSTSLLRHCPEVAILASSREALSIEGETLWVVPSLSTPEFRREEELPTFEELAEMEAIQLFVERAEAVKADFSLTPDNARLVAKICWRLDGIPLAIELAAARVKVLSLSQILTRLDDRFHLLSGGSRTALPRQQTLGALIDWSYDLLIDSERILFRRLSVFVAGRTLEMAEEVCSGEGLERGEIFDLLNALADKSLVMIETGADGESRYTMLESIWDYADDKMTEHGETARYRDRHLDFFVRFAEEAEPALMSAGQKAWLDKLSTENSNLNVALRWSLEDVARVERGLRLAGALSRYWEVRAYLEEGREQFDKLLALSGPSFGRETRAKAEMAAGRLAWCQDRDSDSMRHFTESLRLYKELGRRAETGQAEAFLGFSERNEAHYDVARVHFDRALAIGEAGGFQRLIGTALSGLGTLAADEGNLEEARSLKERSLEMIRKVGDQWVLGLLHSSLGKVCVLQGDFAAPVRTCVSRSRWRENWGTSGPFHTPSKRLQMYARKKERRARRCGSMERLRSREWT